MKLNIVTAVTAGALLLGLGAGCSLSGSKRAAEPNSSATPQSGNIQSEESSSSKPEDSPLNSEVIDELHAPEKGTPERQALMDALRAALDDRKGGNYQPHRGTITFVVNYLKVHNGWAWTFADPHSPDPNDQFGESSGFLLHLEDGEWRVMKLPPMVNDPDDPENLDYPSRKDVQRIRKQYPTAPADIFPTHN